MCFFFEKWEGSGLINVNTSRSELSVFQSDRFHTFRTNYTTSSSSPPIYLLQRSVAVKTVYTIKDNIFMFIDRYANEDNVDNGIFRANSRHVAAGFRCIVYCYDVLEMRDLVFVYV